MSRRRKVFLVLMLLWMAGIFAFSSRSGDESAEYAVLGLLAGLLILALVRKIMSRRQNNIEKCAK